MCGKWTRRVLGWRDVSDTLLSYHRTFFYPPRIKDIQRREANKNPLVCGGNWAGNQKQKFKTQFLLFSLSLTPSRTRCLLHISSRPLGVGRWMEKMDGIHGKKLCTEYLTSLARTGSTLARTLKNKNVGLPWILNFSLCFTSSAFTESE